MHSVLKVVLTLPQPLPTYRPKIRSGRVRDRAAAGRQRHPTNPTSHQLTLLGSTPCHIPYLRRTADRTSQSCSYTTMTVYTACGIEEDMRRD